MSDDIFEVVTSYTDVAQLGQGYIDRADGERILLPLSRAPEEGEGVRFIVHLADGTPAFAGAGRCAQVSDQGEEVAAHERYEALLDSLIFDERSQPVYEYIVAVRQMAYAAADTTVTSGEGGDSDGNDTGEEAVYESEASISGWPAAANVRPVSQPPEMLSSATTTMDLETTAVAPRPTAPTPTDHSPAYEAEIVQSEPPMAAPANATPMPSALRSEPPPDPRLNITEQVLQSVLPQPLPVGILTRPAIAAHWQPVAPRPPRPSSRPSRFRYPAGALPMPASPPRPDLDPSQWIQPAPSP